MGVVGSWAIVGWCLRTYRFEVRAELFQRLILLSAHAFWFWQRNVTYAVG